MTDQPSPSTWATRELPILREALRRLDSGEGRDPEMKEIGEATGIPPLQLSAAIEALANASPPYLDFEAASGWSKDRYGGGWVTMVSERARRELGSWPSADLMLQQLIEALRKAEAEESRPDEKGKIRTTLEFLGGAGRDIAVQVIAARVGG